MRLKIMERDGFACRKCAAKDKTLHVHHSYYTKGVEPWKYPEESLVTLCDGCHSEVERVTDECKRSIGQMLMHSLQNLSLAEQIIGRVSSFAWLAERRKMNHDSSSDFLIRAGQFFTETDAFDAGWNYKASQIRDGECGEFQPIPKASK